MSLLIKLEGNMKRIQYGLIGLSMMLFPATFASAQVSIGIGLPNVSIGINLPLFPELSPVPGYPVYYAPNVNANYFFYDGMYWVYQDDNWYASTWYNGPWGFVEPEVVPLFVLRIPVRYYRQPPVYFSGWQSNAPPRWGQHWGNDWEHRRSGWNRWNRNSVPARAPRPAYQRQYSGDRYPGAEQQRSLRGQSYRYQPRDRVVRQHLNQQAVQRPAPAQRGRQEAPAARNPGQQPGQRPAQQPARLQHGAPADSRSHPPQRGGELANKPAAVQPQPQQRAPESREQRQQPPPRAQGHEQRGQGRGEPQEPRHDNGQGRERDDERGRGRQ